MDVVVSARHTHVAEDLRHAAVRKIGRLSRFLEGMERAEVHFSEERNPRIADSDVCEVTMEGHGHHIRCKVAAPDGFAAVDLAVDKLEHQLTTLGNKLDRRRRPNRRRNKARQPMTPSLFEAEDHPDAPTLADRAYVSRRGDQVVKKKSIINEAICVDDAIERMELLDHGFFLFTDKATGRAAVLYRREDGQIGLIDHADEASAIAA